ncbi:MAG: hypothetical protein DRO12_03825 [Thermoprotei archaeon]|nr:MAG: hypothetical protein DRO12_03825 [Thermoprotei archaeon]
MADETIKPYDYARASIAEMNIVEQLRDLTTRLYDVIDELNEILNDFFSERYEAIKVRFERVRHRKREFEKKYRDAMFHLVRVGIGLEFKDIYAQIYRLLLRFSEELESASLRLYELSIREAKLDDEITVSLQRFLEYIRNSLEGIADVTQYVFINAKRGLEGLDSVFVAEEHCDELYRELHLKMLRTRDAELLNLTILRELVEIFEDSMDTLMHVAENLRWIFMHKV